MSIESDLTKTVILRNLITGLVPEAPTQINMGKWTYQQQQDLFTRIRDSRVPSALLPLRCEMHIFFGDCSTPQAWEANFGVMKQYDREDPLYSRNLPIGGEMVIAVRRWYSGDCPVSRDQDCPMCIARGGCQSQLIRQFVGKSLFPDLYCKKR